LLNFAHGSGRNVAKATELAYRERAPTRAGLPLLYLLALAIGLAVLGASVDLLGRRRAPGAKQGVVAKSVWADRAQLVACKIAETLRDAAGEAGIYLGEFIDSTGRLVRLRYADIAR